MINSAYVPRINTIEIISGLENYLNSRDNKEVQENRNVYGVSACEKLAEYVIGSEEYLDMRFLRAYMEHKSITNLRLKVLFDEGFMINRELMEAYAKQIYSKACGVFNLSFKYRLPKQKIC